MVLGYFNLLNFIHAIISGDKVGLHKDVEKVWMDIWDGAHLLEKAVNSCFSADKGISSVISQLSDLIVFLGHGKAYEALVSVHQIEEDGKVSKVYQPKQIKDMKFVSHSLNSLTNFIREYNQTCQALTLMTKIPDNLTGTSLDKAKEKACKAEGYYRIITSTSFLLNMYFLKDALILLTKFSKELQKKNLLVSDFYNNLKKLMHCLNEINFDETNVSDAAKELFPSYLDYLETVSNIGELPPEGRTRSCSSSVLVPSTMVSVRKGHQTVMKNLAFKISDRFESGSMMKAEKLISNSAKFLNNLCQKFLSSDETIACGHCGRWLAEKKFHKHHKKAHGGDVATQVIKIDVLKSFKYTTEFDIRELEALTSFEINEYDLNTQFQCLKEVAAKIYSMLKEKKLAITPENLFLYLFKSDSYSRQIPQAIKQVLLKILTTTASEAICESYGSTMEHIFQRFKNSGRDLEDSQSQKELFVKLAGSDLANAEPLILATINRLNKSFVLSSRAHFSNISKVLKRKLDEIYDFSFLNVALSSNELNE